MTVHYSSFGLNTYYAAPYFRAQVPENYPLQPVLQKSRAFRRLPPNLRELATLAKHWTRRLSSPAPDGYDIDRWYDAAGRELDPVSSQPLTDAEIDAQWDALGDLGLDDFEVQDIPRPPGGFADPDTWQEPHIEEPDLVDRSGLTDAQILSDIQSRGRAATADAYGISQKTAAALKTDRELAHAILGMHGKPWPQDSTE